MFGQSVEGNEKDDDDEPLLVVSRRPRFFLTEPTEAPLSTPWSQNARRWRNRPENHFLHRHTQQTMWDGWRKLGILEDRKKKKTTRPTRKEPYTGFVFTQRPRWTQHRAFTRYDTYPVPPLHQIQPVPPPHQLAPHLPSTEPPWPSPPLPPPTTPAPPPPPETTTQWWPQGVSPGSRPPATRIPETTTQWWPQGVSPGSRPPATRIPVHIIYPEIAQWEMKWDKWKVRTSATRFTYPPEVVNYPITFDWHVPRHLRTDKWTMRPDWPLESPLFSSEAYDYLEEPTLPRILESGETEFPPTSPLPWWTYPPWWLEKKAVETVNGTTPRPYMRKQSQTRASTFGTTVPTTTEALVTEATRSEPGITAKTVSARKMKSDENSDVKSSSITSAMKKSAEPTQNKLHKKTVHKGPWWHLTIVEHLTTERSEGKRDKRSAKLVRQNAFRRKWRKLRERKNLSHTLDLKSIKYVNSSGGESPSIQHVLSNFTFSWPRESKNAISKVFIEEVLRKALDELKEHLTQKKIVKGIDSTVKTEVHSHIVDKHLTDLHNLFVKALSNVTRSQGSSLLFHVLTNEIGSELVRALLNRTNFVRQQLDMLLSKTKVVQSNHKKISSNHLEKSRIVNLFMLLYKNDLIHCNVREQIINVLKSIYGRNITDFLKIDGYKYRIRVIEQQNSLRSLNRNEAAENNLQLRKKREDIIDITECPFNFSDHSVERVVGEIVDDIVEEIPIDEINQEIKTDVLIGIHENQLKRLGKTNINREVLREMVKLESVDEAKFRNATEESVRKVIMNMVTEVLNTLRKTPWMKDLIIKLFEEGYSVDSVLDTISDQISVEELMNSMEKDGINITRYQKKLVLNEFKDYKKTLKKMLTQEVQLWEYQLAKNQSLVRHRRDVSITDDKPVVTTAKKRTYSGVNGKILSLHSSESQHFIGERNRANLYVIKADDVSRVKRNINDNEISKSGGSDDFDLYDGKDEELDKELAELKRSSMPKREKMKVLRKRLKGLLDQTENPEDIVFPDNFEEELMKKDSFSEEEFTQSPVRFKQRMRWNVRTRKPTTKVITYPMKIRLHRGRPFVPLTTTEEQTPVVVATPAPGRRYRTRKPAAKVLPYDMGAPSTKATQKRQFWLDFTQPPSNEVKDKVYRTTLKPSKTFATLRTFKTMKFVQKTQQPVISLQEFLKRRNEFRREKQGDMFNRPSSEEGKNENENTSDISDLSEEEEFSFDTKLSAEVNPSAFTLPPSTTTGDKPLTESTLTTEPTVLSSTRKVTRRKTSRRKSANSNKTRIRRPASKAKPVSVAALISTTPGTENGRNETEGKASRRKRESPLPQAVTESTKRVDDFNDVTIPPLVITNEHFPRLKRNFSYQTLEDRIHLHNWSYGVKQPQENTAAAGENKTDSFETYQQEHRKWFGIKRRGVPVNNYDIDWDQLRRKMEIQQISAWQRQQPLPTARGQMKRSERIATPLTQATTPLFLDSSEKPSNLLDSLYQSALKKARNKSFTKHFISEEVDSRMKDFMYPPFGRMQKDGQTAFGRLYRGRRHYQLEDSREKRFDEEDLRQFVNKTYDPEFRISTHRKSSWNNRTYDPNYVFTQVVPQPGKTRTRAKFTWREAVDLFDHENSESPSFTVNPFIPQETEIVSNQDRSTAIPKHHSFLYETNITEVVKEGNETYVITRSKRVPWDNSTDIETYKTYVKARKRFYNKTLDIAFSYYIFHKFRCGNKTRDLGYGRMSNVVNRWYNKTFVPKFRPDMFYVRNRYKRGKEFNYFKDEMNRVHAVISEGDFDPNKWMQVATEANLEESKKNPPGEEREKKRIIEVFSVHPTKTTPVETGMKQTTEKGDNQLTSPTKAPATRASFFQAVKEKGFGFFKSWFGKQESNESKD